MGDAVSRLDAWLQVARPEYYVRLLPGLAGAELDAWEADLGAPLPAEFRAFYRWRNGQAANHFKSFLHNFALMSDESSRETRQMLNELLAGGEFNRPNWWRPQWVPFLDNGAGDHYCVDLGGCFGGCFGGVPGQVLMFNHDWENRDIQYSSFGAWLTTVVEAFERGLFEYGEYGMQPVDDAAWDALYSARNLSYPIEHDAG